MWAKAETQFARQRSLGQAEIAFRLQENAVYPGRHVSVRRKILASGAKLFRNKTNRKKS
jgi:hypothetical protein